jgi:hypothetical protein
MLSLRIDKGSMQMVEHQMIYSPERKKEQWSHMNHLYRIFDDSNLLTLLAADPSASRPEWVSLCLFSCLPHPCWVPTDSFLAN